MLHPPIHRIKTYSHQVSLLKYAYFFMCTLWIPKTVVKQINTYLMNCFWRKYGTQERGLVLISWEQVCKPKAQGGLGVLDVHLHNQALLMKFLH